MTVSYQVLAGLAYETTCRPWDVARRIVRMEKISATQSPFNMVQLIVLKARDEGILSFLRSHHSPHDDPPLQSGFRRRLVGVSRTLGRVGPWGFGFLVWESYGPSLST